MKGVKEQPSSPVKTNNYHPTDNNCHCLQEIKLLNTKIDRLEALIRLKFEVNGIPIIEDEADDEPAPVKRLLKKNK